MCVNKHLRIVGLAILALAVTHSLSTCETGSALRDHTYPVLFAKHPLPVWEGHLLAGDPSVIRDGDRLLMYYTDLVIGGDGDGDNPDNLRVLIGVAESVDGLSWSFANPDSAQSVALANNPDSWDRVLETAFVLPVNDTTYYLYYTGYPEGADGVERIVSQGEIGVAQSSDGIAFERFLDPNEPVLSAGSSFDRDGLFSPSIVRHEDTWYMVYAGWSLESHGYGLFGATSTDGTEWTKDGTLLVHSDDVEWSLDNPREAELVAGPDGTFYLFFTADMAHNLSGIGLARSDHPFGPWEVHQEPVIFQTHAWEESGLIAPAVLIEDSRIRVWYMAEVDNFARFYIGYAELEYPFVW